MFGKTNQSTGFQSASTSGTGGGFMQSSLGSTSTSFGGLNSNEPMFGSTSNTVIGGGGFGSTTTGFGSGNTSSFGASTNNSAFGASSNTAGFGASGGFNTNNATTGAGFGLNTNNNNSGFGSSNIGGTSGGFGSSNTFPNQISGFGKTTLSTTGSGFGSTSTKTNFSTATNSGFGANTRSGFESNSGGFGSSGFNSNNAGQTMASTSTGGFNNSCGFGSRANQGGFHKYGMAAFHPKNLELGTVKNPNNDYEFPTPPVDTITDVSFNKKNDYCIVTSWDRSISCYNVNMNSNTVDLQSRLKIQNGISFKGSWNPEGNSAFLACSDNTVKLWDLANQSLIDFKKFNSVARTVCWIDSNCFSGVAIGLWDKSLQLYEPRSPKPVYTYNFSDNIIQFDNHDNNLLVLTNNRSILNMRLTRSKPVNRNLAMDNKYQFRSICYTSNKANHEPTGFALGSIDGRINFVSFESSKVNQGSVSAHRILGVNSQLGSAYPVNCVIALKKKPIIVSGGADGIIAYFNSARRNKLHALKQATLPITTLTVNRNEDYLVYSCGYDWSRGYEYFDIASMQPSIYLRMLNADINR